jgi:D-alanyl-D-alanine endopeptidase (penicillin-binding protein 7)
VRVFPVTLRAIFPALLGAIFAFAAFDPAPAAAHSGIDDTRCGHARAGRRGVRAPRHPSASRRGHGIPWLKGNLPNVQAQGAFVLDLTDGQELYTRRPDEPRPIASISKLAATLTVVDRGLDLNATTTISHSDTEVARGGARSRLLEGMTVPNRDLLHAALLGSDNRAIPALGRAVGLDATQLAAAMTQKVRDLGLHNTRFVEPTGLSPENVSTPREIVDLLRAVMDHPILGEITRKVEYDAHPVGRAPIRYFATYRAAARPNTLVLGAKTGFNNAARYCLVLAARVSGRTVGMAFLGTDGEMTRFGDVARVSDWVAAQESKGSPHESVVAQAPAGATRLSPAVPPASPLASPLVPAATTSQASAFVLPALPFVSPTIVPPLAPARVTAVPHSLAPSLAPGAVAPPVVAPPPLSPPALAPPELLPPALAPATPAVPPATHAPGRDRPTP